MPTPAEISRANGAKSRGPVTPEGKARSSRNALTHGLLAKSVVLECESRERFLALLQSLVDYFRPASDPELFLVHDLACVRWRILRCRALETADLDQRIHEQPSTLQPPSRCSKALREAQRNGESPEHYRRYETGLCRQYSRHLRDLQALQQQRSLQRRAGVEQLEPAPTGPGFTFVCQEDLQPLSLQLVPMEIESCETNLETLDPVAKTPFDPGGTAA